jgi:hypothetical protein
MTNISTQPNISRIGSPPGSKPQEFPTSDVLAISRKEIQHCKHLVGQRGIEIFVLLRDKTAMDLGSQVPDPTAQHFVLRVIPPLRSVPQPFRACYGQKAMAGETRTMYIIDYCSRLGATRNRPGAQEQCPGGTVD